MSILSITIEGGTAMKMKNPAHPGELIKECLDDLGLSVAKAAEALGVTRQQLNNVITKRSALSPEMAVRLEKAFGGTADTWMHMQVNYDLAKVRGQGKIDVKPFQPRPA